VLLLSGAAHATNRCVEVFLPKADPDPEWNCHAPGYRCDYLNMRELPNNKSKILLKLDPGDVVYLDTDPSTNLFKKWKRIYLPAAEFSEVYGWIYIKYTKPAADCKNARKYQYTESDLPSQSEPPSAPPTTGFAPVPQGFYREKK